MLNFAPCMHGTIPRSSSRSSTKIGPTAANLGAVRMAALRVASRRKRGATRGRRGEVKRKPYAYFDGVELDYDGIYIVGCFSLRLHCAAAAKIGTLCQQCVTEPKLS